jgi:hypothetical protein
MLYLGYFAALISLTGIILNAKKNLLCWPVWLFSNVLWIIYSSIEGDIPSVILWTMFSGANVYGWLQWKKIKNK